VLPRARLEGLSQQVMRSTLALLYQWPAGEFIVDEWGFPAADEVWEKPMELLPGLAAVSRSSPHAAVVVQLVREGQIKQIQVRANAIEKLPELPLAPQEAALLRRIGSWKPLGEVLYLDGDGQVDRVGRAVFLLIQLGLVTVF